LGGFNVSHHGVRPVAIAFGALITTLVSVGGLTAATASADQSAVQVTVAYDKATYKSNDTFTVTLTITNTQTWTCSTFRPSIRSDPMPAGLFDWPKLGLSSRSPRTAA